MEWTRGGDRSQEDTAFISMWTQIGRQERASGEYSLISAGLQDPVSIPAKVAAILTSWFASSVKTTSSTT